MLFGVSAVVYLFQPKPACKVRPQLKAVFDHVGEFQPTPANKCDVKTLSQRLGHSNPSITLAIYYHPDYAEQQLIADLDCFTI